MANAKIEITTAYSDGTTKRIDSDQTSLPGTLEGDAGASEARVKFSGADGQGRPADVIRRAVAPAGETFKSAAITMRLNCTAPKTAAPINLTGNVSVSGRVEGECIVATAVNSTGDPVTGVETITETSVRSCCRTPGQTSATDTATIIKALAALLDERFHRFRVQTEELIDERLGTEAKQNSSAEITDESAGVWFGLGFKAESDLQIVGALPGSPAALSAVNRGDRLVAVNSQAVTDFDQLIEILANLSIFESTVLTVFRGDSETQVKIAAAPRLLPNGDMISAFTMDKACGDDCECSKTEQRSICGKAWRYLGDHESGAIAYEEQCITINPRKKPVRTMHVCGVALFV